MIHASGRKHSAPTLREIFLSPSGIFTCRNRKTRSGPHWLARHATACHGRPMPGAGRRLYASPPRLVDSRAQYVAVRATNRVLPTA